MRPVAVGGPLAIAALLTLVACGGDGSGSPPPPPATIRTLAYVISECRGNDSGFFERYALVVREGDRDPVTVAEVPETGPAVLFNGRYCRTLGLIRFGDNSPRRGSFTRLGVSPDGSTVVFEETDAFSIAFHNFLTPEQRGIFVVHADGTALRRLGPPSRESPFTPTGGFYFTNFAFSPDGRTITFPDRGPSPAGDDATQIFTLDLATGTRRQVTRLPLTPPSGVLPAAYSPTFVDNETITFFSLANPDGLNPQGIPSAFRVNVDGSHLTILPSTVVSLGAQIVPIFAITGARPEALTLFVRGIPSGPPVSDPPLKIIAEIFVFDGTNLLQLTNFGRADTGEGPSLVGADGQHVFFSASADPLGTNPSENCQLFSIDRLGVELRQLTRFNASERSDIGCDFNSDTHGCALGLRAQDATTQTLLLASGCDPFGTNPTGEQIFAVASDGSGLRQLTTLRGLFTDLDGSVHAELPGPMAYGPGSLP